jgi:hypothetical protein
LSLSRGGDMPRRIGRRRADVGDVTGRAAGCAEFAFLPAAVGGPVVFARGNAYLGIVGYLLTLVFLVVFGIWGFRLGSRGVDGGDGGGGTKPRDAGPPPPSDGRELTDDFAAWEREAEVSEDEPAGARRG